MHPKETAPSPRPHFTKIGGNENVIGCVAPNFVIGTVPVILNPISLGTRVTSGPPGIVSKYTTTFDPSPIAKLVSVALVSVVTCPLNPLTGPPSADHVTTALFIPLGCNIPTATDTDPSDPASISLSGANINSNRGFGAALPFTTNDVVLKNPNPNSPSFEYPIPLTDIMFDANNVCAFPPIAIVHLTLG